MFKLNMRNAIGELYFIAETDNYDTALEMAQLFEDAAPNTLPNTLYWYEDADGDSIAAGRFDCFYVIHFVRLEEIIFDEGDDLFDDLELDFPKEWENTPMDPDYESTDVEEYVPDALDAAFFTNLFANFN